jgi:hypothetical protein
MASPASNDRLPFFDLIELNGADLRRDTLAVRKATLAILLARSSSSADRREIFAALTR